MEFTRLIIPFLDYMGPPWFRRWLLDLTPNKAMQRLKYIVDTMHRGSEEIYASKKALLEKGDDAMLNQIGEGNDIMSILRKRFSERRYMRD